jgi:hypothetical protein
MTHGIINHHCLNRPYIELYAKMGSCSIVSSGIYFRCGKGGMTHNVRAWRIADNSIPSAETVVDFLFKVQDKIFDE